jgi:hypothetical protein
MQIISEVYWFEMQGWMIKIDSKSAVAPPPLGFMLLSAVAAVHR